MATRTSVKIVFGVFLALCIAIIALLCLEIGYRLSDKYPIAGIEYSPAEIWHWHKNFNRIEWSEELGNHPMRTDKFGFRNYGKDYKNKAENTIRILVIGDSYTAGLSYTDDKCFTGILERKLNDLHLVNKKFEVFNMASPAWSTEQEFLCLKNYGLAVKPDYVLLMTCPNDIREAYCKQYAKLENGVVKFNPLPFNNKEIVRWKLSNYSCFYQYLQKKVFYTNYGSFDMLNSKFHFNFGKEDQNSWDRPMFLKQSFKELDEAWVLYFTLVRNMKQMCDENKIQFSLSCTPFIFEFNDITQKDTAMQAGLVSEKLSNFCVSEKIPYINLHERFRNEKNPVTLFNPDDEHFNGRGHQVTGDALTDYFSKVVH